MGLNIIKAETVGEKNVKSVANCQFRGLVLCPVYCRLSINV